MYICTSYLEKISKTTATKNYNCCLGEFLLWFLVGFCHFTSCFDVLCRFWPFYAVFCPLASFLNPKQRQPVARMPTFFQVWCTYICINKSLINNHWQFIKFINYKLKIEELNGMLRILAWIWIWLWVICGRWWIEADRQCFFYDFTLMPSLSISFSDSARSSYMAWRSVFQTWHSRFQVGVLYDCVCACGLQFQAGRSNLRRYDKSAGHAQFFLEPKLSLGQLFQTTFFYL